MQTVTDPKTYAVFVNAANRMIISRLESRNAKILKFMPIEIEEIENEQNILLIAKNFAAFDWIIFTDVFAVDNFLEILGQSGIDLFELDEKLILAIGEAVSDKLRFAQIHSDLISISVESNDIFRAILNYTGSYDLKNLKFLIAKSSEFVNDLTGNLKTAGAEVMELNVFRFKIENYHELTKLKILLKGGAVDSFIFTAPEDIFYLKAIFNSEKLTEVLFEIEVFSTNEITRQTLLENNLNPKYYIETI